MPEKLFLKNSYSPYLFPLENATKIFFDEDNILQDGQGPLQRRTVELMRRTKLIISQEIKNRQEFQDFLCTLRNKDDLRATKDFIKIMKKIYPSNIDAMLSDSLDINWVHFIMVQWGRRSCFTEKCIGLSLTQQLRVVWCLYRHGPPPLKWLDEFNFLMKGVSDSDNCSQLYTKDFGFKKVENILFLLGKYSSHKIKILKEYCGFEDNFNGSDLKPDENTNFFNKTHDERRIEMFSEIFSPCPKALLLYVLRMHII